jgi:hypothetical protein
LDCPGCNESKGCERERNQEERPESGRNHIQEC